MVNPDLPVLQLYLENALLVYCSAYNPRLFIRQHQDAVTNRIFYSQFLLVSLFLLLLPDTRAFRKNDVFPLFAPAFLLEPFRFQTALGSLLRP